VRPGEQRFEEAQLVEDLQRRGVDGVPTEVAQEVAMLFQHGRSQPGASEEQPGHHTRGAAAGDDHISLAVLRRGRRAARHEAGMTVDRARGNPACSSAFTPA
jgi:hypothetical protein